MLSRSRYMTRTFSSALTTFKARLGLRTADTVLPDATEPVKQQLLARPEECLSIPVPDRSADDLACQAAHERGLFLARQDRWQELAKEIRDADSNRLTTPGGMPVAELLAFGARHDVIQSVEHALADGCRNGDAALTAGINGLEAVLNDMQGDPYITMVLALAHIDVGWAWRGTGWDTIVPKLNRNRCAAHFDRACQLLTPFCGLEMDSPLVASTRCAVMAGQRDPGTRIADYYEDLIDLAPQNHRHMRALGNHMLPRWFGSYDELELEARRTAARTQDIWGAGGYTWVYFDAIAIDDTACARVDVDFFLDGLRDIVEVRPNQEMVNLLAAFCAVALRNGLGLNEQADLARMQIIDAANWLIREHLTELHPMIWAHAADGFDNNARVTSASRFAARGRADALQVIADQFREEISDGLRVIFTPNGTKTRPI